jgi:hypothetical protein
MEGVFLVVSFLLRCSGIAFLNLLEQDRADELGFSRGLQGDVFAGTGSVPVICEALAGR